MIKTEKIEIAENEFLMRTYSDTYKIIQNETGNEYEEAIDSIPVKYTYSESTKLKNISNVEIVNEEDML